MQAFGKDVTQIFRLNFLLKLDIHHSRLFNNYAIKIFIKWILLYNINSCYEFIQINYIKQKISLLQYKVIIKISVPTNLSDSKQKF